MATRLGVPDVSLLPISVGGTISYVRSFDPQPAGYSLVPEVPEALTSSTHMTPGDAVALHNILLAKDDDKDRKPLSQEAGEHKKSSLDDVDGSALPPPPPPVRRQRRRQISIAMHFGTFCSGLAESRDTIRTLRKECDRQGVRFLKLEGERSDIAAEEEESAFVVLDHGGTVEIKI